MTNYEDEFRQEIDRAFAYSEETQKVFERHGFNLTIPTDITREDEVDTLYLGGHFSVALDRMRERFEDGSYKGSEKDFKCEEAVYLHAFRLTRMLAKLEVEDILSPTGEQLITVGRQEEETRPLELIQIDEVLNDDEKQRIMAAAEELMGEEFFERATRRINAVSLLGRAVTIASPENFFEQLRQEGEQLTIKHAIHDQLVIRFADAYAWYSPDWGVAVPRQRVMSEELIRSLRVAYNMNADLQRSVVSGRIISQQQSQELTEAMTLSMEIAASMGLELSGIDFVDIMTGVENAMNESNSDS